MLTDVIYTPVDPLEPMPEVDPKKFHQWIKDNYPKTAVYRDIIINKGRTASGRVENYPWDLTVGYMASMGWVGTFKNEWPELADWIPRAWGIDITDIGVIIFLPTREQQLGTAFWHNDADLHGLRFYIEFEDPENNTLLMRRTKIKHEVKPIYDYPLDTEKYLQKEILTCNISKRNQVFFLNNTLSAHAVHTNVPGKVRIACFISINTSRNKKVSDIVCPIIERSAEKYKDYSLYWKPEE